MKYLISISTAALIAAFSVATFSSPQAQAEQPEIVRQNMPGIYSFEIGKAKVTALSDGTAPLDPISLVRGASAAEIDYLLKQSHLSAPIETSVNVYVIELAGRRILVDTGAGDLFRPGHVGRLPEALDAVGIAPETITDVLITHLHTDHIGGLVKDKRMLFPNATLHIALFDLDFFTNRTNAQKSGVDERFWDEEEAMIVPYLEAEQVETFDSEKEILPGLTTSFNKGHTPGSTFFTLTSSGKSLNFIGDVVHI